MSKRKHARFGPSTLDNLSKCVRFKYQEMGDNSAAEEGTLLHEAFETGDLRGLNEEQSAQVTKLLDYKQTLYESGDWDAHEEVRVELKDLTFGTADVVMTNRNLKHIHVIDAKFGRLAVDSYDMQLRTYGAAVVEKFWGTNPEFIPSDITVETHVVIPRRNDLEHAVYNGKELHAAVRREIEELYDRIADPFTQPTPHTDLCGKCAWAYKCPAFQAIVNRAAVKQLTLPVPEEFALEGIAEPRDRAIAQVLAGAFENWAKQVKKNNAEFVAAGGEVPMHRLVTRSTGLRVPADMVSSAFITLRDKGVPEEAILEGCSIAVGRLADALASCRGYSKGEAREAIKEMLGDLATEGQSQFLQKVKRLSDEETLRLI